jgi:SAM-dependent methyltransferase
MRLAALFAAGALLAVQTARLRLADIPAELRGDLPADFEEYLRGVEKESARRLGEGEWDHLVYYVLQSRRFTAQEPVEPALSAREFVEKKEVPAAVFKRIDDFLRATPEGERMLYFRELARGDRAAVVREYKRAMEFLYEKEFGGQTKQGEARREYVAGLYQKRGYSSDTDVDASFGLYVELGVLREMTPGMRRNRVLVVGPGLNFAPRTALREEDPPESYQPFVLADSLLRRKLAQEGEMQVVCVDVNPRVVRYFAGFPRRPVLHLRWQAEDEEQGAFVNGAGSQIGLRDGVELRVKEEMARRVSARELNVITGRLGGEKFDLAVATNVLLYFDDRELLLAMTNLRAMLKDGGVLIHNDPRGKVEEYGKALGMPVADARMVRLSKRRQLYDTVVMHVVRN